jgi:hypothetical protein
MPETKYVVDENGKRVGVMINITDYQKLLEEAEELEAIRVFDQAKASGEEPVPFEQAVAAIERRRK